jgi:hypothetical protein
LEDFEASKDVWVIATCILKSGNLLDRILHVFSAALSNLLPRRRLDGNELVCTLPFDTISLNVFARTSAKNDA